MKKIFRLIVKWLNLDHEEPWNDKEWRYLWQYFLFCLLLYWYLVCIWHGLLSIEVMVNKETHTEYWNTHNNRTKYLKYA